MRSPSAISACAMEKPSWSFHSSPELAALFCNAKKRRRVRRAPKNTDDGHGVSDLLSLKQAAVSSASHHEADSTGCLQFNQLSGKNNVDLDHTTTSTSSSPPTACDKSSTPNENSTIEGTEADGKAFAFAFDLPAETKQTLPSQISASASRQEKQRKAKLKKKKKKKERAKKRREEEEQNAKFGGARGTDNKQMTEGITKDYESAATAAVESAGIKQSADQTSSPAKGVMPPKEKSRTKRDIAPPPGFEMVRPVQNLSALVNKHSMSMHRQKARGANVQSTSSAMQGRVVDTLDSNPFTFGFSIFGDGLLSPTSNAGDR